MQKGQILLEVASKMSMTIYSLSMVIPIILDNGLKYRAKPWWVQFKTVSSTLGAACHCYI